ncbi:Transcriptional activator spt7 [Smittium culicis]|uniref:Transcriptional activator spt7 n=1 Tax=Smittium culicis TaxID=133412 RepID=A0A1R1YT70_9FUNG|nr:Transcriptional activator spt7 [Smittium culicis]
MDFNQISLSTEKWALKTYNIALEMNRKNLWPSYIKSDFLLFLKNSLESIDKWKEFMTFCKDDWLSDIPDSSLSKDFIPSKDNEITINQNPLNSPPIPNIPLISISSESDPNTPLNKVDGNLKNDKFSRMLAAVYVRAIIFEQYVSAIYPFNCDSCSSEDLSVPLELLHSPKLNSVELSDLDSEKTHDLVELASSANPFAVQNDSQTFKDEENDLFSKDLPRKIEEFDDFDESSSTSENQDTPTANLNNDPSLDIDNSLKAKTSNSIDIVTDWFSSNDKLSNNTNTNGIINETNAPPKFDNNISNTSQTPSYDPVEQNINQTPNSKLIVPVGLIYHTLENDLSSIKEVQQFESDRISIKESVSRKEQKIKLDNVSSQVSSIPGIKNLAAYIDLNREQVNLSSVELANLLSEVRPKKNKWNSDEIPGQEELYTSLENVLTEIKNMGSISLPFLSQVKRRDAPDYYDVISNPMDLGTMSKRLKNLYYRSKKEFEDDIKLIRNNCYQYNTAPSHPYRKQADLIVKKADQLLSKVTDYKIMERMLFDNDDELNTEFGDDSDSGTVNDFGNSVSKSNRLLSPEMSENASKSPAGTADSFSSLKKLDSSATNYNKDLDNFKTSDPNFFLPENVIPHTIISENGVSSETSNLNCINHNQSKINSKRVYERVNETLSSLSKHFFNDSEVWERTSKDFRSNCAIESMKRLKTDFPDQKALLRTSYKMENFALESHSKIEYYESPLTSTPGEFFPKIIYTKDDLDLDEALSDQVNTSTASSIDRSKFNSILKRQKLTLDLMNDFKSNLQVNSHIGYNSSYDINSGIPDLKKSCYYKHVDFDSYDSLKLKAKPPLKISEFPCAKFPQNKMFNSISNTIDSLSRIRIIDNKINIIKFNISVGYYEGNYSLAENQTSTFDNDFELNLDIDKFSLIDNYNEDNKLIDNTKDISTKKSLNFPYTPISDNKPRIFAQQSTTSKEVSEFSSSKPKTLPKLDFNKNSGSHLMNRICSLILAHVGFEKLTAQALGIISEVVIQYITNLGQTLRIYTDNHSKNMSSEAILAHALHENGVESLDDLKFYCDERIEKMELKIADTEKKLLRSYEELVSGASNNQADDLMELTNDDSLVNGDLSAVGDDFFGFKELGLDKEFGIDVNKGIPNELWFGKARNKFSSVAGGLSIHELKYIPPPLWNQVSSLTGQIGLFVPFLTEKFSGLPKFSLFSSSGNPDSGDGSVGESNDQNDPESIDEDPYITLQKYLSANSELLDDLTPLVEDEILPMKSRYGYGTRPKVPPPNNLKKKTLINNSLNSGSVNKNLSIQNKTPATKVDLSSALIQKLNAETESISLQDKDSSKTSNSTSEFQNASIDDSKSKTSSDAALKPEVTGNADTKGILVPGTPKQAKKKLDLLTVKTSTSKKRKDEQSSSIEAAKKKKKTESATEPKLKATGKKSVGTPTAIKAPKQKKN